MFSCDLAEVPEFLIQNVFFLKPEAALLPCIYNTVRCNTI